MARRDALERSRVVPRAGGREPPERSAEGSRSLGNSGSDSCSRSCCGEGIVWLISRSALVVVVHLPKLPHSLHYRAFFRGPDGPDSGRGRDRWWGWGRGRALRDGAGQRIQTRFPDLPLSPNSPVSSTGSHRLSDCQSPPAPFAVPTPRAASAPSLSAHGCVREAAGRARAECESERQQEHEHEYEPAGQEERDLLPLRGTCALIGASSSIHPRSAAQARIGLRRRH